jgi:hypothetical protein
MSPFITAIDRSVRCWDDLMTVKGLIGQEPENTGRNQWNSKARIGLLPCCDVLGVFGHSERTDECEYSYPTPTPQLS